LNETFYREKDENKKWKTSQLYFNSKRNELKM